MDNKTGNCSVEINALLDLESPISFVKERFIPRDYVIFSAGSNQIYGINGSDLEVLGYMEARIMLDIKSIKLCCESFRIRPCKVR